MNEWGWGRDRKRVSYEITIRVRGCVPSDPFNKKNEILIQSSGDTVGRPSTPSLPRQPTNTRTRKKRNTRSGQEIVRSVRKRISLNHVSLLFSSWSSSRRSKKGRKIAMIVWNRIKTFFVLPQLDKIYNHNWNGQHIIAIWRLRPIKTKRRWITSKWAMIDWSFET